MGHRHRLEVDETISPSQLYNEARMGGYFSGWRFGASEGYEGPGQNVGIPMYAIGIYDQQSKTALTSGAVLAHAPHALTRTAGSFVSDGWGAGRAGYISDNSANNGKKFVVAAISGNGKTMTIRGDDLSPLARSSYHPLLPVQEQLGAGIRFCGCCRV